MISTENGSKFNPEIYELAKKIPAFSPEELEQTIHVSHSKDIHPAKINELIDTPKRMPVIAIDGMPNTFKSTTINWLMQPLREMGIKASFIPEPKPRFDKNKYKIYYAIAMWHDTLTELLGRDKKNDELIFLDRSFYSSIAFLDSYLFHNVAKFESDNKEQNIPELYLTVTSMTRNYRKYVDGLIIVDSNIEKIIERERFVKKEVINRVMDKYYLNHLKNSFGFMNRYLACGSSGFDLLGLGETGLFDEVSDDQKKPVLYTYLDSPIANNETPEIDQYDNWDAYSTKVLKTVGTFCRAFTSGRIH